MYQVLHYDNNQTITFGCKHFCYSVFDH